MLIINPDLINSCRVCRSPNQDGDYQCLFENTSVHEAGVKLSEAGILYEKLLEISLNQRNYYPQFLCNSCDLQMKLFSKLKDKALKTLDYLQGLYGEVVDNVEQTEERETLDDNLHNNEEVFSANGAQDYTEVLDDYPIKEYEEVCPENEADNHQQIIDEQFTRTLIDETINESNENTNYNCHGFDVEYELDKLRLNNSCSQEKIVEECLYTEQQTNSLPTNIETNFVEDSEVHIDSPVNNFFTKIEPYNYTIENSQTSEENLATIKLEPLLDKNDYVTEIYQLIDDESNLEEHNLNSQDIIDYDSYTDANTETGSTYNDIEYLVEEGTDDFEGNASECELANSGKRRRLNNGSEKSRIHTCIPCQLEFQNAQEYKLHRTDVHNEQNTCNECSKEFKTVAALQRHIKIQHSHGPAFQCEICQKTFNQKAHYIYHMNYHNNIRNFKCDMCEKAFITKADLKTHQRTHTGERPYVCNICGKDYLQMEHLKAHFITHTDQSFYCNFCNKQFATHKTLRLHVRTIHEDAARFKCTICLKPFRRKHHLEYHMKSHQQNNVNLKVNAEIINEPDNLEVLGEESVDDPGFIYLTYK